MTGLKENIKVYDPLSGLTMSLADWDRLYGGGGKAKKKSGDGGKKVEEQWIEEKEKKGENGTESGKSKITNA